MNAKAIAKSAPALAVRTLVLYNDFATGLRAKQCLDHLLNDIGMKPVGLTLWRLDLLHLIETGTEAAPAAAEADLLVISMRGDRPLESRVEFWVTQWIENRNGEDGALVVLMDAEKRKSSSVNDTLCRLQAATWRGPVGFFVGFVPTNEVETAPKPLDIAPALMTGEDVWMRPDSTREWGINE